MAHKFSVFCSPSRQAPTAACGQVEAAPVGAGGSCAGQQGRDGDPHPAQLPNVGISELRWWRFSLLKRVLSAGWDGSGVIFGQPVLPWMSRFPCRQCAVAGSDAVDKEVTHFHHRISRAQCIYILFNFTPILFA